MRRLRHFWQRVPGGMHSDKQPALGQTGGQGQTSVPRRTGRNKTEKEKPPHSSENMIKIVTG